MKWNYQLPLEGASLRKEVSDGLRITTRSKPRSEFFSIFYKKIIGLCLLLLTTGDEINRMITLI